MKYLFSLMLIGLFVFTASAQKFPQADLIVNGVGNGTPYATFIKKFGKPKSETELGETCGGFSKTLSYDGLDVEMIGDENGKKQIVLNITITSAKWITDKGVKIGDNYKTVLAKYGKTKYEDAFDESQGEKVFTGEKSLMYVMKTNGPGRVNFYFKNDRLIRIELIPTIC